MADAADGQPKKGGRKGLVIGLVLALLLGGGGFYVVYSGLLSPPLPEKAAKAAGGEKPAKAVAAAAPETHAAGPAPLAAYLPLEPIVVTLAGGQAGAERRLQVTAQLEVDPGAAEEAERMSPRVADVLNTYLRAVAPSDVEDPAQMLRMRAQMLRRVQVVLGRGVARDLLVTEFILR
jgi:flagellar FliL protein